MPAAIHTLRRLARWAAVSLLPVIASPTFAADIPPPLVFREYPLETESHGTIAAEVAYLDVPLRHAVPDGARTRLRVVRLRALDRSASAAPVVYLAGGPGGSGVGTARGPRWPVFNEVRRHVDVLLLDQRGTGMSEPPPACPYQHRFTDSESLQRDATLAVLKATAARCAAFWGNTGVDLGAYTTNESADDLEALRKAINVPRISLWGMSYGTHLAMAAARRHETVIDRLVLMGAEGPDQTLKLPLTADALLAELASLAEKDGFPDLAGSARRVLAAVCTTPAEGRSLMHRGRKVMIGCLDAQLAISASLGRRSTQQMLPLMLRNAEDGNLDLMASLVLSLRQQLGTFDAMPLAMEVASAQSAERRARFESESRQSLFGEALAFPFPMLGEGLGLADLGPRFRAPLKLQRPVLLVNGTLDGRTPMVNRQELLPGLQQASLLEVNNASHDDELWLGNAETSSMIARFLSGARIPAKTTLNVPPPTFAKDSLALLEQAFGVSRYAAATAIGVAAALLMFAAATVVRLRRRHVSRRSGRARQEPCGSPSVSR